MPRATISTATCSPISVVWRREVSLETDIASDDATGGRFARALAERAQAGLRVRLLVDAFCCAGPRMPPMPRLLGGGVRLYEYRPRMLHAKSVVPDGESAMVATSNLDDRSFHDDDELNLISADPALCGRLEDAFEADLAESAETGKCQAATRR